MHYYINNIDSSLKFLKLKGYYSYCIIVIDDA